MGGKASYCQQETLLLALADGEITEVAIDSETQVEVIADPAASLQPVVSPTA